MRHTASALWPGASDHGFASRVGPAGAGSMATLASAAAAPVFVARTATQLRKFSPSVGQSKALAQSLTVGSGVAHSVKS